MVTQLLVSRGMPKASQADARYTPAGGRERCGGCRHFMAPSACNRILGPVTAVGWCRYYSQQPPRHTATFPGMGPPGKTLDLTFMSPGTLDPRIVFTRASTATHFDVTGTMQTAAANMPRWDYNPTTHVLNGLFGEEARTNLLLNSATLGTQGVAVTAQAYTLSFYGTGTVTMSGAFAGALVGAGAFPARASTTFTPAAGTLTCTVTGSVLSAQLEAGAFVTSYIPTVGVAATRAAELCSMPIASFTFNTLAFSYQVQGMLPVSGAGPVWIALDDGTVSNRSLMLTDAAVNLRYFESNGGATTSNTLASGSLTPGVTFKAAVVTTSGRQSLALNGVFNAGWNTAVNPPTVTTLHIGCAFYAQGSAYIQRISYWPRALSNAELQSVTT